VEWLQSPEAIVNVTLKLHAATGDMIVPTKDSVRYKFLMSTLIAVSLRTPPFHSCQFVLFAPALASLIRNISTAFNVARARVCTSCCLGGDWFVRNGKMCC
jgi:hypothetical protein